MTQAAVSASSPSPIERGNVLLVMSLAMIAGNLVYGQIERRFDLRRLPALLGSLLAVARVAGETAPLLFTALGSQFMNFNVTEPMAALPLTVFNYAIGPYAEWHQLAWATALVLILVVLVLSIAARLPTRRRFGING